MTLSRWRRLATGIAAGVLVLCAAILGAQFRSDSNDVSVASELRPTDAIAIPEDTADAESTADTVDVESAEDLGEDDPAAVDGTSGDTAADDTAAEEVAAGEAEADGDDAAVESDDPVRVIEVEDLPEDSATADPATDDSATADPATDDSATADPANDDSAAAAEDTPADDPAPAPAPPAPAASNGETLGTGGGVDDAECGLDRLIIYAGAPVSGVAGRLRAALAQNGFGAGCAQPITVLASNCPQQFSGILRSADYDPLRPYVAASASLNRDAMISIVGATGYTGNTIDILDFGFVNADQPGEQWIAIFVPPSFAGWEGLAGQAGLAPTSGSLCGPSGELGR